MLNKDNITSLEEKASANANANSNVLNITTSRKRESILVTGGAGFIGSNIAKALLSRGKKVIVLDVFNQETTTFDEKQANISTLRKTVQEYNDGSGSCFLKAEMFLIRGDIRDRHLIEEIIASPFYNITSVIHAAALVDEQRSFSCSNEYLDVNIKGTNVLLEVLGKSNKIIRVIIASSSSVYSETKDKHLKINEVSPKKPISPYGASKVAMESLAYCYSHLYQMQIFIIRIASCYGYRGRSDMMIRRLMENIEKGEPTYRRFNGEETRTWIYINDVVDCFIKALYFGRFDIEDNDLNPVHFYSLSLCEDFNIGAKEGAITLNNVIAKIENVMSKKANIIDIVDERKTEAKYTGILDYSKANILLGWEPKYTLEQGLQEMKSNYESEKHQS
jgi:UDP-glucuronate 4-epimerase